MRLTSKFVLGVLMVFASPSAFAQSSQPGPVEDARSVIVPRRLAHAFPTPTLMQVGRGWNSEAEEPRELCVDADTMEQHETKSNSVFYHVTNRFELEKALQISASASATYYGASGSAAYNLDRNVKITEDMLHIVATGNAIVETDFAVAKGSPKTALRQIVDVRTVPSSFETSSNPIVSSSDELEAVRLKGPALALFNKDPNGFRSQCGDSFIEMVVYGGEYAADLSLKIEDRSEYQRVSQSLTGGYKGGEGFSGTLSFSKIETLKQYEQGGKLLITFSESGTTLTSSPTDLPSFLTKIQNFSTNVSSLPNKGKIAMFVVVRRYDQVGNWPKVNDAYPKPLPESWSTRIRLARKYSALEDLQASLEDAYDDMGNTIGWFDDTATKLVGANTISQALSEVQDELKAMRKSDSDCALNPATCVPYAGWTNDYKQRAVLPAVRDELDAWHQLRSVNKDLDPLHDIRNCGSDCTNLRNEKTRLTKLQDDLQNRELPLESVNKRFEKWLELPRRARCDGEGWEWGCVDIDVIQKMKSETLRQYGISYN